MFYNCFSLSSLPDISKWNTNNIIHLNFMFCKCTSLTSIADISKWKIVSKEKIFCLFSDCLLLLYYPDISSWNNYNKNDSKRLPNYFQMNNFLNFTNDMNVDINNFNEISQILNNDDLFSEETDNKFDRFYI